MEILTITARRRTKEPKTGDRNPINYEAIHEYHLSLCDQRNVGASDAAVDDAHSLVLKHERANAIRRFAEECRGYFRARADGASTDARGSRICLPPLRADDSSSGDIRHHGSNEGYREGADPIGSAGSEVERRGREFGSCRVDAYREPHVVIRCLQGSAGLIHDTPAIRVEGLFSQPRPSMTAYPDRVQ